MPDNPQSEPTPEEIKHLLQEALLRSYPNPERKGCFDPETLRSVAKKRIPHIEPQWQHITHCSPCYQEFLGFRAEVLELRRGRRRVALITAGAIAAAALIGGLWLSANRSAPKVPSSISRGLQPPSVAGQDKTGKTLTAVLNMEASPTRGSESPTAGELQRLPRRQMAPLLIYLPFGSDPGTYKIDLLRDERTAVPLASFSGTAEIRDGLTVLQVSLDFSTFPPGTYLLAVSREGEPSWKCKFVLS